MVKSIKLFSGSSHIKIIPTVKNNKITVDSANFFETYNEFTIEINFELPIKSFRDHDFTWSQCKKDWISNVYSPKIISFENGTYVQPNTQQGIWEFNKNKPNQLLWKFNPQNSKPLTYYSGEFNEKIIANADSKPTLYEFPTLLFSTKNSIEFSRSIIPFSAVACFTDHCDFDTLENLKLQRDFFANKKIKTTKGFFINHFSKRGDNASYEINKNELDLWKKNGHELCYHSLSQSIKTEEESFYDFENFLPPYKEITTWIDHGYQPYNLSLYQNFNKKNEYFETVLSQKNISTLWNYIDCGTATNGVINQLNTNHFTLSSFLRGNKSLSFIKRLQLIIKNIIFHYYASESIILKYKSLATSFKNIVYKKRINEIPKLIKTLFTLAKPIMSVFIFWHKHKNKPFKLAKYAPLIFKHTLFNKEFYIFQTVEMIDFKKSLSPSNIDLLIQENGVFIAHTYFSVPMKYHQGKMFKLPNQIDESVATNFDYLSQKIQDKTIWNPTLNELIMYLEQFETALLDIDQSGIIYVKNNRNLNYRIVN